MTVPLHFTLSFGSLLFLPEQVRIRDDSDEALKP